MAAISDFAKAMLYYTGGSYHIDTRDPQWRALASRIVKGEYTPEEFIHWFITAVARGEPARLTHKNYVVCEKTWDTFLFDKKTRVEEVGIVIQLQREKLDSSIKLFGPRSLLNDNIEVNPALRIEVALYMQDMEGYDPMEVLHAYKAAAEHMLMGCPEYRMFLPYLNQAWGTS